MSTKDRRVTTEVAQFSKFNRDGDVIPHGWNQSIGEWHTVKMKDGSTRQKWRSRPFAERLLARIVWRYTPSPVIDDSGKVLGYKRKFDGPYWVMNPTEMAEALGCSVRTITDETKLLRKLGLIITQPVSKRIGAKLPRNYVVPQFDAIAAITPSMCLKTDEVAYTPEIIKEETSTAIKEETSTEQRKKLPSSSLPSSVPLPIHGTGDQIAVPGNATASQNEPTPVIPISSTSGGTDMADATTIAKADAVLLAFASKDKSDRSILRQRMSDNGKALMTEFHTFTGLPWMRTWNSAANEMDGLGVRPEHVKAACVRLKTSGMTVVDLHSVKKTAIAVMADARSGKANGGSNGHANGANGYAASPLPGMAAGERITGYQRASDGSMIPIIQTSRNGGVNGAGSSSIH